MKESSTQWKYDGDDNPICSDCKGEVTFFRTYDNKTLLGFCIENICKDIWVEEEC